MDADTRKLSLPTRAVLAHIRCLQECIECYRNSAPLPEALCYVPGAAEYKVSRGAKAVSKFPVYRKPDKGSGKTIVTIGDDTSATAVVVSGVEMCNRHGQWIKLEKVSIIGSNAFILYPPF